MNVGRYIMRPRVFQGRVFAGWALAGAGAPPSAPVYGRLIAAGVYASGIVAGESYQSGHKAAQTYSSGIVAGSVQ
jgi:hypothetical protein